MVHGSGSDPEAFLNAHQTKLLGGLAKSLSMAAAGEPLGGSIQIDNIVIKTESLDSNQDFKKAGQTLAEALNAAISKRGISVNTRR